MWFDIIKLDREYLRSLREKGYEVPEEMTEKPITDETLLQEIVDWFKEKGADVEVADVKHNGKRDATASSAIGLAKHTKENPLFTRVIQEQMPLEPRSKKVKHYKRIVGDESREIGFYLFSYYPTNVEPTMSTFLGNNWERAIERSWDKMETYFMPSTTKVKVPLSQMRAGTFYKNIVEAMGGKVTPDGQSHITGDSGNEYTFNFTRDCNISFYKKLSDELKNDMRKHYSPHLNRVYGTEKEYIIPNRIGPITMCIHEQSRLPLGDSLAAMLLGLKNDTSEGVPAPIKAAAKPLTFPPRRRSRFINSIFYDSRGKHPMHINDGPARSYLRGDRLFPW
jgi:hypothetical protein